MSKCLPIPPQLIISYIPDITDIGSLKNSVHSLPRISFNNGGELVLALLPRMGIPIPPSDLTHHYMAPR